MLVSKITPTAKKIINSDIFNVTTEDLDHMTVIARPYVAGASKVNFQINFGNLKGDLENNQNLKFNQGTSTRIDLTSDELSTWGTDDSVLLQIVANKLNLTILETIEIPDSMF
jgi:hypothetical protein